MPKKSNYGGVWPLKPRLERPHPYGVQWRETIWDPTANHGVGAQVEKTKTEFFDTIEKRDARAAVIRRDRKKGALRTASRTEAEDWRAFQTAVNGTPWQDVVAGWRSWMIQSGLKECTVTVDEAVKAELARAAALVAAGRMSPDTFRQKDHKLPLFAAQFGHLRLNQVTAPDVEAWIEDFDQVESEATFNNYRKHASTVFTAYVASGVLLRNPVDNVKLRDASTGEVGILTVKETAHLFHFANSTEKFRTMVGRLALEAFIGLRFSSGCRLEKKDINFDDRGILLPKKKLKTKKRHYIDGLPGQVWEWLAVTPEACWDLTARQYMELKSRLFVEAGVPHPHNCLRHSFCTYDVAAHKNPGRTAYILCHRNQDLLWDRYKGNAKEADGVTYQAITPATAQALAAAYVPLSASTPRPA